VAAAQEPAVPYPVSRQYEPDTNVLRTRYVTDGGEAVVRDALAVGRGGPLHLGDQHLAVRVFDVGEPQVSTARVHGAFTTAPGSRGVLALSGSDDAPVYACGRELIEAHLDRGRRRRAHDLAPRAPGRRPQLGLPVHVGA